MKALVLAALAALVAAPASAATVFFDFGDSNQPSAGNVNNVFMNPPNVNFPIANAIDDSGNPTGINLTMSGFFNGSNTTGATTPSGDAAVFGAQATRDNAFGHAGAFGGNPLTPEGTISVTGLDPSTPYTLTFFGARLGVSDSRETKFVVNGAASSIALLETSNNTSNVATFSNVLPTGAGSFDIKVSPGPNNNNGSLFYYVGAMAITPVPEPASLISLGAGALALVGASRRSR